jgi:hypothetical protein
MAIIELPEVATSEGANAAQTMAFDPGVHMVIGAEAWNRDRRMATLAGPRPSDLARLSPAHRACIAYHMAGRSAADTATRLGRPVSWVVTTLNDPLSKRVIQILAEHNVSEIAALTGLATAAIREQLIAGTAGNKLRAADMVFRSQGMYATEDEKKTTAEDVIQEILKLANRSMDMAAQALPPRNEASTVVDITPTTHSIEVIEQEDAA